MHKREEDLLQGGSAQVMVQATARAVRVRNNASVLNGAVAVRLKENSAGNARISTGLRGREGKPDREVLVSAVPDRGRWGRRACRAVLRSGLAVELHRCGNKAEGRWDQDFRPDAASLPDDPDGVQVSCKPQRRLPVSGAVGSSDLVRAFTRELVLGRWQGVRKRWHAGKVLACVGPDRGR